MKGGEVEDVKRIIETTPLGDVHILNPQSRFVIVTYWWGRDNFNKNLQSPCPEDIVDAAKQKILAEIGRVSGFPSSIVAEANRLSQKPVLSSSEKIYYEVLKRQFKAWSTNALATVPELGQKVQKIVDEITPGLITKPESILENCALLKREG